MQNGWLTGANTSLGSLLLYKIYEQSKCLTITKKYGLWFLYQPILMSIKTFNKLNLKQQNALLKAGKKAEDYLKTRIIDLDIRTEEKFRNSGVNISYMNKKDFDDWVEIAKNSSYVEFSKNVRNGKRLIDMALSVE